MTEESGKYLTIITGIETEKYLSKEQSGKIKAVQSIDKIVGLLV